MKPGEEEEGGANVSLYEEERRSVMCRLFCP